VNAWYAALSERERRFVALGAAGALVLLLVAVVMPLYGGVAKAKQRVERKQADLAWMQSVAPQVASAPAAIAPASQQSLIVVIDNSAREAGLSGALTSSEPAGNGTLRVRLEKAPFDLVVTWVARLSEQHAVGVDSATFERAGAPGIVNAGIVLRTR
jgi:type II secretory pathway component PulM